MRQLQQAKQAFPSVHLIVGVTGDKETHRRKGLTVLSAAERAESVRHCKWVDEVIEDCPWIISDAPGFMERHAIDYVAHDDIPYGADEGDDIYAPIKRAGKFLVTQRTEGVSTTGIITKIVRDYDGYIARQLSRGASRQELNVSWLKKNEIDVKHAVAEMRDAIRSNWSATGQELSREIKALWQPASSSSAPRSAGGSAAGSRPESPSRLEMPSRSNAGAADFAAGYSLGLLGGVRSWVRLLSFRFLLLRLLLVGFLPLFGSCRLLSVLLTLTMRLDVEEPAQSQGGPERQRPEQRRELADAESSGGGAQEVERAGRGGRSGSEGDAFGGSAVIERH
jgi:choline-phosphate cytidylyltransferase